MIDDFEGEAGHWETNAQEDSTIECGRESGTAHSGTGSLRIRHTIAPDGWGDCARGFENPQDWSAGTGISFWLRSDRPVEWLTLIVFCGDPNNPTPFELEIQPATGDWTP